MMAGFRRHVFGHARVYEQGHDGSRDELPSIVLDRRGRRGAQRKIHLERLPAIGLKPNLN